MLSFDTIEHFHIKLSRIGISIVPTDQTDLIASCLILPNDRCSKKFLHITCLTEQVLIWHLNGLDYFAKWPISMTGEKNLFMRFFFVRHKIK